MEQGTDQGIVLYTDGGCRPNPGCGGWGMHGYLYVSEPPKKPAGNPDHVLTLRGYVAKSDAIEKAELLKEELQVGDAPSSTPPGGKERRAFDRVIEVTPVHYIDGYGSFEGDVSNNIAELTAATMGLRHAADYDIRRIQIFTDSEYVCRGLESWVEGWRRNNWLKADGTVPANIEYWKELVAVRDILTQRGVEVRLTWVKGHTAVGDSVYHFGNVLADRMATLGVMASRRFNETKNMVETSPAEGYWKYAADRHPFIANRRMYFNTMKEYIRPGEYYLGEHGKEDDLLGKRIADGAYSVVILEEPDPALELIRTHQSTMSGGTDTIVMACLDYLYRADTHQEIMKYGTLAMEQQNAYRLDLHCLDRQPLTRELRPPRLAMRAVETVSDLAEKLHAYAAKDEKITTTDLTGILYETTVKVGKKGSPDSVQMKLKPEYNVGYAALDVQANYEAACGNVKAAPVTLTLGIDLLDRNSLKRLEDRQPKVILISWLEAPNVFRYATVVEAGGDKGIWAGAYSNLRVVTEAQ